MYDARFHNHIGDEYELFKLACPYYDELQNSVGDLIKENFSDSDIDEIKVLEIGYGKGATSATIINSDKRVKLTAIDNEEIMYPQAVKSLEHIDKDRYELFIDDALGFLKKCQSDSFDVIASGWVIHNFLNKYRLSVLKEIYRVLKPGGLFINADKIEVTDRAQHEMNLKWQIEKFEVYDTIGRPELKKEWTDHYLEDAKPGRALIENEFEEAIRSCGFKSFQILKRWYDDAVALIKNS